eukprot:1161829-Pelagomonas_calceolata.AAC.3
MHLEGAHASGSSSSSNEDGSEQLEALVQQPHTAGSVVKTAKEGASIKGRGASKCASISKCARTSKGARPRRVEHESEEEDGSEESKGWRQQQQQQ